MDDNEFEFDAQEALRLQKLNEQMQDFLKIATMLDLYVLNRIENVTHIRDTCEDEETLSRAEESLAEANADLDVIKEVFKKYFE